MRSVPRGNSGFFAIMALAGARLAQHVSRALDDARRECRRSRRSAVRGLGGGSGGGADDDDDGDEAADDDANDEGAAIAAATVHTHIIGKSISKVVAQPTTQCQEQL